MVEDGADPPYVADHGTAMRVADLLRTAPDREHEYPTAETVERLVGECDVGGLILLAIRQDLRPAVEAVDRWYDAWTGGHTDVPVPLRVSELLPLWQRARGEPIGGVMLQSRERHLYLSFFAWLERTQQQAWAARPAPEPRVSLAEANAYLRRALGQNDI